MFQIFCTFMDDEEATASMDTENPRKLDFNAPLLSTRRPNSVSDSELPRNLHADSGNRVPFSWEKSPGKPKGTETRESFNDTPIPPPRPPPGWKPTLKQPIDQENDYDGDDDDNFSDAIDTFSLSEALDIMIESAAGGLTLEPKGSESPSFIIQRFLLDAKALAVSSGLNISKISNSGSEFDFPGKCVPQGVNMESCSSPKGCGLDVFFPWRMKHKPCGAKIPVRVTSSGARPACNSKQKQNSSSGQSPSRSGVSMNFSSMSNSKK